MKTRILLLSLFASTAYAGEPEAPNVHYKAVTEIDMVQVDLQAPMVKPEVTAIGESARPIFNPMIRLREDFKAEMRESVLEVQ